MLVRPNLLLLDEPSNHLDIPARDMLVQALQQYTGTLCLISHDRHLINAVANKILVSRSGRVEVFPGNFDDYQRMWMKNIETESASAPSRPVLKSKPLSAASVGMSRVDREARKKAEAEARQRLHRFRAPLIAEIGRLEKIQAELGKRLDKVSAALADPATYRDAEKGKTLSLEHARRKAEMEETVAAWEEAALRLEELEQGATDVI